MPTAMPGLKKIREFVSEISLLIVLYQLPARLKCGPPYFTENSRRNQTGSGEMEERSSIWRGNGRRQ